MAKEKAGQTPDQDETPSMEEILQSIRGVISGDEAPAEGDDVLELTEMVEVSEEPAGQASPALGETPGSEKSILDDIDEALDNGVAAVTPAPEPIAAEPAMSADDALAAEWAASAGGDETPEEKIETPVESPAEIIERTPDLSVSQTSSEADMTTKNDIEDTLEAEPAPAPAIAAHVEQHVLAAGSLIAEEVAKESSGSLKELVNSVSEKHVASPTTRNGTSLEELVIEAIKPFLADWLNKNLPAIVKKIVEKEVKRLIPKEDDDY